MTLHFARRPSPLILPSQIPSLFTYTSISPFMASEITEEEDEDSYFITNKEAQKQKIRQLIKHQKNHYNSSSSSSSSLSSSSLSSTALCSSSSSFDQNQSRKLLNLMRKGSTSLRRLFDMEHTTLGHHFEFYSGSPETKTIPLWGSDSDDAVHEDPWLGITKFYRNVVHQHQEHEEHKERQEHVHVHEARSRLTRKKSTSKLRKFYKFRFRFRFRLKSRLRIMFCGRKL